MTLTFLEAPPSHVANVQRLIIHKYPPLSVARYSLYSSVGVCLTISVTNFWSMYKYCIYRSNKLILNSFLQVSEHNLHLGLLIEASALITELLFTTSNMRLYTPILHGQYSVEFKKPMLLHHKSRAMIT